MAQHEHMTTRLQGALDVLDTLKVRLRVQADQGLLAQLRDHVEHMYTLAEQDMLLHAKEAIAESRRANDLQAQVSALQDLLNNVARVRQIIAFGTVYEPDVYDATLAAASDGTLWMLVYDDAGPFWRPFPGLPSPDPVQVGGIDAHAQPGAGETDHEPLLDPAQQEDVSWEGEPPPVG